MPQPRAVVYHDFRYPPCVTVTIYVMVSAMMTAHDIVEGCGGTVALASSLDLTPSTVSSWRSVNHIPRWWQQRVLQVARRKKFALTAADFPPKQPRRKAAA